MRISLHGGSCCGIKHISGLGYDPHNTKGFDACAKKEETPKILGDAGGFIRGDEGHNFFWPEAPQESALERLDRYLAFLDEVRPKGICEIVLTGTQLIMWRTLIQERGFVQVNKCYNSNTSHLIYVFHRNKE